jgi:phage-related holin
MKAGKWSSAKLREGAWHKGGMVIIVCVALVADWLIGSLLGHIPGVTLPFNYTVLLGPMMIVWYILGELGSLAEHAVNMGAKIPGWLPRILAISKEAVDAAGDAIIHEGYHDAKGENNEAH